MIISAIMCRNVSNGGFDVDGDGYFTVSEIESVKEMRCANSNIASLQGIQFFSNLTILFCDDNKLKALDISKNMELTGLSCSANQLTTLDLSNNFKLFVLSCNKNQLTSLDVRNNRELSYLYCNFNHITSLDVSENAKLNMIVCGPQSIEIIVANRKTFDMRTLISEENLSKVTIDSDIGTYDPETGIIVFNEEQTSFKYYYGIGKNDATMDVTVTLKMHEHTYGDYVSNGDGTHTRHCTFDGCTDFETENCSGGAATCKDKAVCEICGEAYGELNPENHTGEEVWEQTETTHTKKWNCCGKVTVEEAAHTFEHGVCTVCEYTCAHTGGTATCKDKAICEICGEAYGEMNPENHTGKEVWEQTETTHTKKWSCCSAVTVPESDHKFEDGVCIVCAYPCTHKDENTDHKCDICGETVSNHSDENHDHLCDICGKAITNHVDENNNHVCDICGKTVSNHIDSNTDHVCDICGETVSTHTGGTATCKDKAVCEICGEEYGELNPENHTGGTHLEHEKAATCTEKGYTGDTYCSGCNAKISDGSEIPTKPHTPGEKWVIENGKKVKKCTECGAIAETAPRMPGDVDGDGEITALDYLYLKRYILGTFNGEIVLENADVDGDGRIDATDYLYLKRGYLGTFDLSKFA